MPSDANPDSGAAPSWQSEEGLLKACDFLFRNAKKSEGLASIAGPPKRVLYSRPKHLVEFLVTNEIKSSDRPDVQNREQAMQLCSALVAAGHMHRAIKPPKDSGAAKNELHVCHPKHNIFTIESDTRYTWMYEGKQGFNHALTALLIVVFLAITCFPIWPRSAKVGLWYCSVTLLGIFAIVSFVRAVVFMFAWLLGWDFWILPRLFDDNVSFLGSFKPLYSLQRDDNQSSSLRIFVILLVAAFTGWIYSQPTEFDHFIVGARQFTEDLYEGKLLPERSQQEKDDIDKVKMPSLEELMKEQEENLFESGEDEDAIVDRFMDEKFFSDDNSKDEKGGEDEEGGEEEDGEKDAESAKQHNEEGASEQPEEKKGDEL